MRSSHRSSVDGVSLPVIPGGSDVQAGSPDVNRGTVIGEAGLRIINGRGGNGDRLLDAGRRVVACVLVIVSGGYDDGDTAVIKLGAESPVSGDTVTFIHPAHTALTALSVVVETGPPKLIEATEGPPVLAASLPTQSMPATL